jgi:hypothetical protein
MKTRTKWWFSFGHSFILMALSLMWLHTPYNYGDENFLVKWSAVVKRLIFQVDVDPPKDNFLFVNLAYEKALIPLEDKLGNEVITDRAGLAKFFEIQKRHPDAVKFTICDVFLKGKSVNDSLLTESISGIDNVIFPNQLDENQSPLHLDVRVPNAIADYSSADEGFLKFELIQTHNSKTIPVYMYEKLEKRDITQRYGLNWDNGIPSLNSIIIDYQIHTDELFEQNEYPILNLSELILLPEDIIVKEFLQNRIVVMGDFEHDLHKTTVGIMPGSLILLNVYLSLKSGYHFITFGWLVFMIFGFTFFSRIMIFGEQNPEIQDSKWLSKLLQNTVLLTILSISSYFLFNISIQVLFLAVYTSVFIFIQKTIKEKIPIYKIRYWFGLISNN